MNLIKSVLAITLVLAVAWSASAAEFYAAQYRGNVYSSNLDATDAQTLATGGDSYRFVAIDVAGDYLYTGLGAFGSQTGIHRYNLDGSGETAFATGQVISDSALAVTDSSIFWISSGVIRSSDLDGSNAADLYTLGSQTIGTGGSGLNIVGSSLYWAADSRRVQTAGLDGSNPTQIFDTGSNSGMTSLFTDGNYFYYALSTSGNIHRRDMDGSNETILAASTGVRSLQIVGSQLYWMNGDRDLYAMDLVGGTPAVQLDFDTTFTGGTTRQVYMDIVIPEPASLSLVAALGLTLIRRRNH